MKRCPKCYYDVDDSVEICPKCNTILESSYDSEDYESARNEIDSIRNSIARLNERLNLLEHILQKRREKPSPAPVSIPVSEKKKEVTSIINKPGEKKSEGKPDILMRALRTEIHPADLRKKWSGNYEQMLGEKWFNKLGILAVVIGVALLLNYSFVYLGAVAKIAIGIAFGIGLLSTGVYLEKKKGMSIFGKTLIAGGWAISYFTAYAMHHIASVRLIASPVLGLFVLLAVAVAAVMHIYTYKSQLATGFSYLLIFVTLMIGPVSLYTLAATTLVALSIMFFMYKLRWNDFAVYGMLMTYVTLKVNGQAPHNDREFILTVCVLVLYWGIFTIGNLLMKDNKEGEAGRVVDRIPYVKEVTLTINTVLTLYGSWAKLDCGFMKYLVPVIAVWLALYAVLTVVIYMLKQRNMYLISSTVTIILAMAYLANTFTGFALTAAYIILAQAILLAGVALKEVFWRKLSFALLLVILGRLFLWDSLLDKHESQAQVVNGRLLLYGFAFAVYFADYLGYSALKNKGQTEAAEEQYPAVLSYTYPAIYAMGTWLDLPKVLTAPLWIFLGVILLQVGVSKDKYHLRVQGYILSVAAFIRLLMSNFTITGGVSVLSYRLLTAVPVLVLLYYGLMLLKDQQTEKILRKDERGLPAMFAYIIFGGIMYLARYELPDIMVAPAWGLISVGYLLMRGLSTRQKHYLVISIIAALCTGYRAAFINIIQPQYLVGVKVHYLYPIATIAVLYAGNVLGMKYTALPPGGISKAGERRLYNLLLASRWMYGLVATIVLTTLLVTSFRNINLTAALSVEGLLLFLLGFGIKEKAWRIYGLMILLAVVVKAFLVDLRQLSALNYILSLIALGVTLIFVSYVYSKNKDKFKNLI